MYLFDINNIVFEIWGYPLSFVELTGTVFGLLSVYWASKANIWTWPVGVVNVLCMFALFFQVQLYANMFLQIVFFGSIIYGWIRWKRPEAVNRITRLKPSALLAVLAAVAVGTAATGWLTSGIHVFFPQYFPVKAPYPYIDSFVMVASVAAMVLLAQKRIENWHFWLVIDVICVALYMMQGIYFIAAQYAIFTGIAVFGLMNWRREITNYELRMTNDE